MGCAAFRLPILRRHEVGAMRQGVWVGCFRFHGLLAGAVVPEDTGCDGESRPVVLLQDGVVWDACRRARHSGVRPGQEAAAVRHACPTARRLPLAAVGAPGPWHRAWDLLARAASIVEPSGEGRPEALASWPAGPPPLHAVRALCAEVAAALPHVDLAIGLAENPWLARACCPKPGGGETHTGLAAAAAARATAAAAYAAAAGRAALPLARRPWSPPLPLPSLRLVPQGGGARWLAERGLGDLMAWAGLPPALHRRLEGLGLLCCGDVVALTPEVLRARFGRAGERLYDLCRGRDATPVRALYPPRTRSVRRAYPEGLPAAALPAAAAELAVHAARHLAPQEGTGRLILRTPWGEAVRTWPRPRCAAASLARAAADLAHRGVLAASGARATGLQGGVAGESDGGPCSPGHAHAHAHGHGHGTAGAMPGLGGAGAPKRGAVGQHVVKGRRPGSTQPSLSPSVLTMGVPGGALPAIPGAGAKQGPKGGGPGRWPDPAEPVTWLEVILADLVAVPVVALRLWGGRPEGERRRATLDDLVARFPPEWLRRGCGVANRYETLLAVFDPWYGVADATARTSLPSDILRPTAGPLSVPIEQAGLSLGPPGPMLGARR